MTKLLDIRTVYNIDPAKTFRIADILEAGAILPRSVNIAELLVMDLEPAEPVCYCYEYAGDNPLCPDHGEAQEFSDSDILDHSGIYCLGMGC